MNEDDDDSPAPRVLNPPDEIFLVYDDLTEDTEHSAYHEDVTWSADRQFDSDVRYVREKPLPSADEVVESLAKLMVEMRGNLERLARFKVPELPSIRIGRSSWKRHSLSCDDRLASGRQEVKAALDHAVTRARAPLMPGCRPEPLAEIVADCMRLLTFRDSSAEMRALDAECAELRARMREAERGEECCEGYVPSPGDYKEEAR